MVPATMCRTATVAFARAVVAAVLIGALVLAQAARADAPPPSDTSLTEGTSSTVVASSTEGSSPTEASSLNDWFDSASASDWSWSDWFSDEGAATASESTASEPTAADAAPSAEPLQASALLTTAATTTAADTLAAPTMSVSGQTVSWTPTQGVSSYVFARKIPGQATQYSIVNGTSTTPPAVAGTTVTYGVRTNVSGSAWAQEASITYPASSGGGGTTTGGSGGSTGQLAAPTMSVSGQTVSWTPTQGVSSYVFARKIPGQATQYSIVNGTSTTPPAVAGTTVTYGVRTNVSGSAWAQEASITYPGSPTPTPTPTPTPSPTPSPTPTPVAGPFQMGVVAGSALSYELSFIKTLGAHTARLDFGIGTSASSMASVIDAYARAGIRPMLLATYSGLPTTAQAQNLASWAAAYGPGGTFWAGKSYPANTAVTDIEFGNETSYSYQFSDNSSSTYAARAKTYALAAKAAATAIAAANPKVGLLVQGDNAQQGTAWMTNMLAAVPNLADLAAGWTIHPYGPNWATRIDSTINSAQAAGARALPIWVTEWGLSSDNGRCLDDNYGFDKCMTYSEAASTLHSALSGMLSRYGSRLGAFFLYQAHDQYATGTQSGREAYFGAMQSNGAAKGAYTPEVESDLAAH